MQEKAEIVEVGSASLVCKWYIDVSQIGTKRVSPSFGQIEVAVPPTYSEALNRGEIITFRHHGLDRTNKPDSPTFILKRFDLNPQLLIKNP